MIQGMFHINIKVINCEHALGCSRMLGFRL